MSEFQREERYIVIKIKDLCPAVEGLLRDCVNRYGIPTRECAVVEANWPSYEETWENIQRLAEGRPSIAQERDALAAQVERLRLLGDEVKMAVGCVTAAGMDWTEACEDAPETSLAQLKARVAAEALPEDVKSHKRAWLSALVRLIELEPDETNKGYYQHELGVMRRVYDEIAATRSGDDQ